MSASLVGSEMCIRDRPQTPQPEPEDMSELVVELEQEATMLRSVAPRSSDCLLYTSDAADDM
eukprot:11603841-Alexandrium_andersonii.AAC.1